jgi:CheY-like chemotaxis protein
LGDDLRQIRLASWRLGDRIFQCTPFFNDPSLSLVFLISFGPRGSPMRTLLVVDDSPVARRALAHRLETDGFDVIETSSAASAKGVESVAFAGAIIDLELADSDGPTLAEELLRGRPDLPVAFFTSSTNLSLVERARAMGPVFVKPDVGAIAQWAAGTTRPSQPPPTK